jgi:copper chaperone
MEVLKFKTNLHCGGCVKAVSNFINAVEGIKAWSVDTQDPAKILSVEADPGLTERIVAAVQDAGFEIQEMLDPKN